MNTDICQNCFWVKPADKLGQYVWVGRRRLRPRSENSPYPKLGSYHISGSRGAAVSNDLSGEESAVRRRNRSRCRWQYQPETEKLAAKAIQHFNDWRGAADPGSQLEIDVAHHQGLRLLQMVLLPFSQPQCRVIAAADRHHGGSDRGSTRESHYHAASGGAETRLSRMHQTRLLPDIDTHRWSEGGTPHLQG